MWAPLGAKNWVLPLPQIEISPYSAARVGDGGLAVQPQAPHAPLCTAHATDHHSAPPARHDCLAYAFMQGSHRRQQLKCSCRALLIIRRSNSHRRPQFDEWCLRIVSSSFVWTVGLLVSLALHKSCVRCAPVPSSVYSAPQQIRFEAWPQRRNGSDVLSVLCISMICRLCKFPC